MRDNDRKEIHRIDPETICQFTGLIDKDGKEIYEGDIIYHELYKERSICKWIDKHASFGFRTDKEYGECYYFQRCDEKEIRVIGNIYGK